MSDIDINEIIKILQSQDNQKNLKNAIICELHKLTKRKDLYLVTDKTLKNRQSKFYTIIRRV